MGISSQQVARSYQRHLPIKLLSQPKKGITFALKRALAAATCDLVLTVDADTVLPPHWVKNVKLHFTSSPTIDDQLLTHKLKHANYPARWFPDCLVYHSTRRWHQNPAEYFYTFASLFSSRFYTEKRS